MTGEYEIAFRIYDIEEGGTSLWSETDSVSCTDGLYIVFLGFTNPLHLGFDTVYWLGIQIAGDAEEMSPRCPLASVPHSFRAVYADSAGYIQHEEHDHGDWMWTEDGTGTGLNLENYSGGLRIESSDPVIVAYSPTGPAIVAMTGGPDTSGGHSENGAGLVRALNQIEPGSVFGTGWHHGVSAMKGDNYGGCVRK